jgi:hypothetical protein
VLPHLRPEDEGKLVLIDIETGDWECWTGRGEVPLVSIRSSTYSSGGRGRGSFPSAYLIPISQELAAERNSWFSGSSTKARARGDNKLDRATIHSQLCVSRRIQFSRLEQGESLVRERRVEIVGDLEETVVLTDNPARLGLDWNQPRDRLASSGNDDLLAASDAEQQTG